jgi:histone H3/H4
MLTSLLSVLPDGTLSPNDQANVLADLERERATLPSPTPEAGGGFSSPADMLASMPVSTRDLVLRRLSQAPTAERTAAQAARRAAQAAAAEPMLTVLSAAAKAALVDGLDAGAAVDLPYERPAPLSSSAIVGFDDEVDETDDTAGPDLGQVRAHLAPKGLKRGRTAGASLGPRPRPPGLQPLRKATVKGLVRDSMPPGMRLDPDAIPVIQEASLDFLDAAMEDVTVYAMHRRGFTFSSLDRVKCTVGDDDVLLLLKRQRITSATKSANALARELLPPEVVEEMLAVARAHNVVDPTGADKLVASGGRRGRPKRTVNPPPAI